MSRLSLEYLPMSAGGMCLCSLRLLSGFLSLPRAAMSRAIAALCPSADGATPNRARPPQIRTAEKSGKEARPIARQGHLFFGVFSRRPLAGATQARLVSQNANVKREKSKTKTQRDESSIGRGQSMFGGSAARGGLFGGAAIDSQFHENRGKQGEAAARKG